MSKLHYIQPTGKTRDPEVVRLGASGAGTNLSTADEGKLLKLAATDRYDLAVAGDAIEGVLYAVEPATSGGFTIGGRITEGLIYAVADGLQGTPGTGVIAAGDLVVAGTITAKGTALASYPKVCKATLQTPALFNWRVVSLGTVGTGAVGTIIVIERV